MIPQGNVYTPKNARSILFERQCDCVDTTCTTGQIEVVVTPTNVHDPKFRCMDFQIRMMDLRCDKCHEPFARRVVEHVVNTEEQGINRAAGHEAHRLVYHEGTRFSDANGSYVIAPGEYLLVPLK